jgi:hypothetical protein
MRLVSKVLAGALLLLAGCPSPAATTGTGAGSDTTVKPLETKAPANESIILGTTADGGSTRIKLADGDSSVSVDSMWVKLGSPVTGGSSPVKLTVGPNTDGKVKVGMYEEFSGGIGSQWRAGVWLAAFISSSTLNKDLTDFTFTADSGGNIDGASASGLMTAGYLAAMTGTPIDPKATMTGIINPDGTIGPVGGIPHKFAGSMEKGKTRLGFPIGMRKSMDMNSGEMVDLVQVAKAGGAEATEISDVYGAYELMTGQKLPRPIPVDDSEMELEDEVVAAFDAKYAGWQTMLSKDWDMLVELDGMGQLPAGLLGLAQVAQDEAKLAEKLRSQGMAPSAYKHMINAWVYAASATSTASILQQVRNGDIVGAKTSLQEIEGLASTTESALRTIGEMRPDTMGGHLQMLSSFDRAIAGLAAYMHSNELAMYTEQYHDNLVYLPADQLNTDEMAEYTVQMVAPTVLAIARAVANTSIATESADIEGVKSLDYMCSLPNVKRLATSYHSAASANVTYFETLVGVTDDASRNIAASREPDYLTAYIAANIGNMTGLPETLKGEWGEDSLSYRLMTLSAAELAYFKASTLISKWYSLGVQTDWLSGRATSVEHEKAFMNMLTSAEKKARENAKAAKVATGSIPVQARIAYQNARVLREGDLADKLDALEGYWQSSAYSQTAVMLARN